MNPADTEARRALARQRAIATGLLVLMGAITLGTYAFPPTYLVELLQAAAKAGFVGGVADWFAVTALFRHPLGLPIPHTAIIPAQKARLGQALGRFVANHVVTLEEVSATLGRLDLPGLVGRFLDDPAQARPLARLLATALPRLLTSVEDGRARRLLGRLVPRLLGGAGAGIVVARALRGMVDGGRHQEMFGFMLTQLRDGLAAREDQLRQAIEDRVREQGGRLVGWALGASVARRVLTSVNAELDRIGPDGSEMRQAFDEWARREIRRIEEDPARAAEIGAAVRKVLVHETVQAWVWDVWARLRRTLEADAANPSGRSVALIEGALAELGQRLASDPAARAQVERAVAGLVATGLPPAREKLADFIARVVTNWDTATIVDRIELRVGPDLQYVRMNGTLVGFLVGGLVYAVLRATFGHVVF
jgi:uncharacterized membrane-anchored protein YjiN (DUF445 family)